MCQPAVAAATRAGQAPDMASNEVVEQLAVLGQDRISGELDEPDMKLIGRLRGGGLPR